jgi:phage terminase large subunit GpA-like protein
MSFVTTTLAEPWEDRGGRVEPHALASRLEDYGGDVDAPSGVVCLTAGVDVQIDRYEVGVWGWGVGGESWLIDSHTVPGDPTTPEVQSALLASLDERYSHASGQTLPILTTCIDSGFLPEKVAYALAARRPRRVFAVKGAARFGEPSILKYDARKPPVLINVDALKFEVALGLEMAAPGPGYVHLPRRLADEEFLAQLCAEHRETRRRNGVATLTWVQDRARNEALDCAAYARGALRLLVRLSGRRSEDSLLAVMAEQLQGRKIK